MIYLIIGQYYVGRIDIDYGVNNMLPNLINISSLIESYSQQFPIFSRYEAVKNLVESYKFSGLYVKSIQKRKERFKLIRRLVGDYSHSCFFAKAGRYDLFKRLKLILNENELTKITADMLNPKISPFGKSILVNILNTTEKHEIARLIQLTDENRIEVKREQAGDNSRIDIRVYTKNSYENVIVDFELKVRNGSETVHPKNGTYQTVREWEALLKLSEKLGIKPHNIVAYFITPHGSKPKSNNFVRLARHDLNQIICDELIHQTGKMDNIDIDSIGALSHFFNSAWLF